MDELEQITTQLLRFAPDALIVVDQDGRICFANDTVMQVLGYTPDALLGKPLEMLIPERLRDVHRQHLSGFVSQPSNREMGARIANLFALRADGSEFAAGIRLAPFRIAGKSFIAAAIRDNTERQQVNTELVTAREDADRANRAKSRFLATASHDLRQPMQTIRLLNAALLRIVDAKDGRELLQQQQQAIASITRLLDALLDIGRLESGAIQPGANDVSLAQVFDELRTEFASVATARNVRLLIESPAFVIRTDKTLLCQLLQNLLGNALKYTDHGSVLVHCSLQAAALTIVVEDTGVGIPADKLERIFDEYYQVDTHGTKRLGVGLGLAIVKEVARLLGFTVRIASRVGAGTQAYVSVPRERLVEGTAPEQSVRAEDVAVVPRHKPRLILVEDNDGVRLATELFLKFEGYETLSASSVTEMERLAADLRQGDIVIADYHLDGKITGFDLLGRLRARLAYDVPGIILSGDLPGVLRALKPPVARCHFLSKPVDTTALLTAIEELSH